MKEEKFKEVFIFVAGATPQIITETLYALVTKEPPVYPDEIFVITTSTGKKAIEDAFFERRIFEEFKKEYGIPEIPLTKDSILVIKNAFGEELQDIRDKEDNTLAGNFITSFIRDKAKDTRSRLHCSLAGGRKTMGFYLGSALQLFGRPWDRLYHVLVSQEFESNPEFFYKPKLNKIIKARRSDGEIIELNTDNAKIELAELPFIRLGSKIEFHGKEFEELVEEGQKEIDIAMLQPVLQVNLRERTVMVGSHTVEMIPVHLMIYTAFLRQKTEHCKYPERLYCLECIDCFPVLIDFSSRQALEKMAEDYKKIYWGQPFKAEDLKEKWRDGIGIESLRQYITKINKAIKDEIDERYLPFCQISSFKIYGATRYGIRIEKTKIKINE
ncbi:MAG: CRISPR-associated ring nuclease Csm6 [Thermodesulfovibrionales bacterium]|nr:CRISPR-associated ring nuclease Csm6 [Thermodesulfovibrionales bacterium]